MRRFFVPRPDGHQPCRSKKESRGSSIGSGKKSARRTIRIATMSSVLVTGARGFIGGHVIEALARTWPEVPVVALDRSKADLLDFGSVRAIVASARPTHVIHAAGSHGRKSAPDLFALHAAAT